MTNEQTTSWIFLAIAISSEKTPVDFSGISQIADGINHSVPTQKEMQSSISWLNKKNLISIIGKKYSLSELGKQIFERNNKERLLETWASLEEEFKNN